MTELDDRKIGADEGADTPSGGLGPRMDRLLRAAEQEAAEIRQGAERYAAALLTQAHAEIDRHDRDRRREWQDREAAVAESEQRAAVDLAAAREQAAGLVSDARAEAEVEAQRIRGHAYNGAKEIIQAAERSAAEQVAAAAQEVERLEQLREAARAEVQRLLRTLDGVRVALAYDLETGVGSAVPAQHVSLREESGAARGGRADEAVGALGRRRGDRHRTRHIGLAE